MSILLIAHAQFPDSWRNAFTSAFREHGLTIWPDRPDPATIDCAIVARTEPGALRGLPNLQLISSVGMGVDHILADPDLPSGVPIARVATAGMIDQMAEYATLAVLRVERDSDAYDSYQAEGRWVRRNTADFKGRRHVGILGLGIIGREIARRLVFLGFPVSGWTRSPREVSELQVYAGPENLPAMLARSDILICALPRTPETINILNRETFAALPRDAHVINVARGEHLVDDDLIDALESGQLSGATLDVFRTEPLPPEHPFWKHPKIRITPHSAGMLFAQDAIDYILNNLARVKRGEAPLSQVIPTRGY